MKYNYHTHTFRCKHAQGADEDYVLRAIDAGLTELGFADHTPYPMDGYCSSFRMPLSETAGYIASLSSLREKYADRIKIRIGFEVEYYPRYFGGLLRFLSAFPYEYLILGQHYCGNEIYPKERHVTKPIDDEAQLAIYADQVCEGMRTGAFSYLAHPDVFNYSGDEESYRRQMAKICETAKELDLPLEINGLGIRGGRSYPDLRFWKLAGEYGCKAVFGCDAHRPEDAWDEASYETARKIAEENGLPLLDRVTLRRPDKSCLEAALRIVR